MSQWNLGALVVKYDGINLISHLNSEMSVQNPG